MKKLIIAVFIFGSILVTPLAQAQTVSQDQYQTLLRQVIALLTQQVQDLQTKLAALQAAQASSTVASVEIPETVSTSSPIVINVLPQPAEPVLGEVQTPATTTMAALAPVVPVKTRNRSWPSFGSIVLFGSSTAFQFACGATGGAPVQRMDLVLNGDSYPLTMKAPTVGELKLDNDAAGLESGKWYEYMLRCETATQYGGEVSEFKVP